MIGPIRYDEMADAIYVRLSNAKCAYTKSLGALRNVDYSADNEPIGVELLCVSDGVDLSDLPYAEDIGRALQDSQFKVLA